MKEIDDQIGLIARQFVTGDYVISGVSNAFNGKTSFWISKRGCTVAVYCFSARTRQEVEYQIRKAGDQYIELFEATMRKLRGDAE